MAASQLPLAMVGPDERARVAGVRGGADLRQHLAELATSLATSWASATPPPSCAASPAA